MKWTITRIAGRAAATFAFALPVLAGAQSTSVQTTPTASTNMTDGEVRKIDKDAKKLTLRHAEIKSLDMPGMTMVFQMKDPAMLDSLKVGDKVRFEAERIGGAMVITEVSVAPGGSP